ncbi:Toxin YoeB [Bacteroidales bacterium Barb6XT]|nr:Toxin YoeB [Bacteroidales bacterium Barb6XT]
MIYKIDITSPIAKKHIAKLYKSGDKVAVKRFECIMEELKEHPETGTGNPNRKKYDYAGCWSRKITDKHRLLYTIDNEAATVTVISAYGHYDDK